MQHFNSDIIGARNQSGLPYRMINLDTLGSCRCRIEADGAGTFHPASSVHVHTRQRKVVPGHKLNEVKHCKGLRDDSCPIDLGRLDWGLLQLSVLPRHGQRVSQRTLRSDRTWTAGAVLWIVRRGRIIAARSRSRADRGLGGIGVKLTSRRTILAPLRFVSLSSKCAK
jgi:hypothetical protein